jgi:hypothetical protein
MSLVHDLFDRDEIERRKQLVRDLWAGKAVDVTTRDDVPAIHRRLREISVEYARRIDWGWE